MRSFTAAAWMVVLCGGANGAVIPVITPVPSLSSSRVVRRDDPDAVSLAQVLLTAIPESLREIAATNVPAVSSILNEEFLGDSRPEWFLELPYDIQTYLISKFGPATAALPTPTGSWASLATVPASSQTSETGQFSASQISSSSPESTPSSEVPQSTGVSQTSGASQSSEPSQSSSGFSTSVVTRTSSLTTPVASSTDPTATESSTVDSSSDASANPTSSTISTAAPGASGEGLTKRQKIGLGVGIPMGLLGAAVIAFAILFLCRRRQRKRVNGSIPPSSPGFIPRFSFMEKGGEPDQLHPLYRPSAAQSFHDLSNMTWDDDAFDPSSSSSDEIVPTLKNANRPIMAPALYHTHSSNRARGKRTSYQSLHSVAEVTEPDSEVAESPILGRHTSPGPRTSPKRSSPPRSIIPSSPIPAASTIKRKPLPSINSSQNPAASLASQSLLRQTMPNHASTQPAPPLFGASFQSTSSSSSNSPPRGFGNYTSITSNANHNFDPISPISPTDPFANPFYYEEDYGPEYQTPPADDRFEGVDGMYGGHTSLSRYPETPRRGSIGALKTEWPLRNFTGGRGRGRGSGRSQTWDRVYEG